VEKDNPKIAIGYKSRAVTQPWADAASGWAYRRPYTDGHGVASHPLGGEVLKLFNAKPTVLA